MAKGECSCRCDKCTNMSGKCANMSYDKSTGNGWTHSMARAHAKKGQSLVNVQIQNKEFKNSPTACTYLRQRVSPHTGYLIYELEIRNIDENDIGKVKQFVGDQTEASGAVSIRKVSADLRNEKGELVAVNYKITNLEYIVSNMLNVNYIKALEAKKIYIILVLKLVTLHSRMLWIILLIIIIFQVAPSQVHLV